MAHTFYPTEDDIRKYWNGHRRRSASRINKTIGIIFTDARDKVTRNILEALNNRRYLKIKDPKKRLRVVKNDPKMKQVDAIILQANIKSLNAIYKNFEPSYKVEVPAVCRDLYPWYPGQCKPEKLTKKELANLTTEPYEGRTWHSWILGEGGEQPLDGNMQLAQKKWRGDFRATMTGEIRTETAVSRDVQLVQAARSVLDVNENRNNTIFENSDITVARKAMRDVEIALWPLVSQ